LQRRGRPWAIAGAVAGRHIAIGSVGTRELSRACRYGLAAPSSRAIPGIQTHGWKKKGISPIVIWTFPLFIPEAYEEMRRLSPDEALLVTAYDRANVLLSGMNWLDWIYLQGRVFDDRAAVCQRLDEKLARLAWWTACD